ncbi:hypothetical protein DL98DRAFT_636808 [Cadophora sp. DSE1049]|nr:hypothetical protein DL98DRAFT_636808 [Cadophora sp. DSE1049]
MQDLTCRQFLILAEVAYAINITVTKLLILSMYYRIFPVRSMKIGGWILEGTITLWSITLLFVAAFQCVRLEKFWMPRWLVVALISKN